MVEERRDSTGSDNPIVDAYENWKRLPVHITEKLKCIRFKFHIYKHKSVIDCKAKQSHLHAWYSLNQLIKIVQFVQTVLFTYRYLYDKGERSRRYWLFVYSVTGNAISHQIRVVLQLMMTTSHRTHHNHSLSMTSYTLISVQMIPQRNMLTFADIVTVTQRMLFAGRVTSDGKCAFFVITHPNIAPFF